MSYKKVTLGELCNLVNGKAFKPEDWSTLGVPIIRIQNLNDSQKPFNYWLGSLDNQIKVKMGDLLLAWSGTPGTSFGAHIWKGVDGILNQHIFRVDLDSSKIMKEWAVLAINNQLHRLIDQAHGGVGLKHVTKGMVENLVISLPPLPEQKRIASILDKADGIRRKRREAIRLTDELLRSLFLEILGDPLNSSKKWEVKELGKICHKITDGVHAKPNYTNSGIPFISVKDITTGRLIFDDCKFISIEDHKLFSKRCKPDYMDILYTKVGATYGRPVIVDTSKEFSIYVSVALIKPNNEIINPVFLKEVLASPIMKRQADKSIKGIGVPDLHLIEIKNFLVPVPPMNIQNEIVNRINQINNQMCIERTFLSDSELLFNSLVQRAFRGEL